jgi:HlyD family secretion protein
MSMATKVPPGATELGSIDRTPKTGKKRSVIFVAGFFALLAASLMFFSHHEPAKKAAGVQEAAHAPVLTVSCELPSIQPIEKTLLVHGTVSAWDPIVIGATTSGLEVKTITVDEGAFVKKGQVLLTLDSATLQAQIRSERARLAESVANQKKSVQPNRPEDINQLIAAVAQAEATVADNEAAEVQAIANAENAKANAKRYEQLVADGAVSVQEADDRQTTAQVNEAARRGAQKRVDSAKASLKQAQEKLSMAKIGGRKEDIEIADATVKEIEGNVSRLATQIDQTIVRAPVDGFITRRDVHLGDISSAGKTMFLMARDNRLELKAQVPDTDLSFVKPGQVVTLESALNKGYQINGRVREISPLVDADTRLATVRIDLPNMYAEGQVKVGAYSALTVPAQAVVTRDEKNTVFVLKNDQVEKRTVVIGNRNPQRIEIISGILPSDEIVVDGAGFLQDGDYVAVGNARR